MKKIGLFFWSTTCFLTGSFCIHYAVYRDRVGWLAVIALLFAGAGGYLMSIAQGAKNGELK